MAERKVERRLVAILAADVVSYSRLMEADEAGTVSAMQTHRRELWDPRIAEFGGRLVGTAGDSLLVEFQSVVAAAECAVAVQRGMATRNADLPGGERMQLRVGINIGEVIVDGDNIYGEGVNIAARLEGLREPGGVVLSDEAHRQGGGKTDLAFVEAGEHQVKNISQPVRMWRWIEASATSDVVVSAGASPRPPSNRPSIAVLAFDNMSGDPDETFLSDGISEDIITALSRFHFFFVIARNTSFTYKGKSVDVKQVARELGVQYVLEGSVRRAGNRVRVSAQLVDGVSDRHVWADRYDRELEDIFDIQDEITESISGAVAPELQAAEIERVRRSSIRGLGVWELVARANWHVARFTATDSAEAHDLLAKALEIDHEDAVALAAQAQCYGFDGLYGWHRPPAESVAQAAEIAERALILDIRNEAVHTVLGQTLLLAGRHDEAIRRLESAVQLNPNYSQAIGFLGMVHVYVHRYEEAITLLNKAMRLSPRDPMLVWYVRALGMNEFFAERYQQAIEWFDKAIDQNLSVPSPYRGLALAYGMLGDRPKARSAYEAFDRRVPGATIASQALPFAFQEDADHFVEALRRGRAGRPDSSFRAPRESVPPSW